MSVTQGRRTIRTNRKKCSDKLARGAGEGTLCGLSAMIEITFVTTAIACSQLERPSIIVASVILIVARRACYQCSPKIGGVHQIPGSGKRVRRSCPHPLPGFRHFFEAGATAVLKLSRMQFKAANS